MVGAPGVILALVVVLLLRDPREDAPLPKPAKPERFSIAASAGRITGEFGEAFRTIWESRANRLIMLSVAFAATANYGMLIWGPIYLQRMEHGPDMRGMRTSQACLSALMTSTPTPAINGASMPTPQHGGSMSCMTGS